MSTERVDTLSHRLRVLRDGVGAWGLSVVDQEEMYKTLDYQVAMAEGLERECAEAAALHGRVGDLEGLLAHLGADPDCVKLVERIRLLEAVLEKKGVSVVEFPKGNPGKDAQ